MSMRHTYILILMHACMIYHAQTTTYYPFELFWSLLATPKRARAEPRVGGYACVSKTGRVCMHKVRHWSGLMGC